MESEFNLDIICQVYAGEKSLQKIEQILHEFLPDFEPLDLDYAAKVDDEAYVFGSESEMLSYFIDAPNVNQTFYWNGTENNPDRIMVGANITNDNQLIMSLTLDGTEETEAFYFQKLKLILKSDIGVVSYFNPAEYKNGQDFCFRYGNQNQ